MTNRQELNELSSQVINAAIEVHSILGPGLLETAYHVALAYELSMRGLKVESEVEIPMIYKDIKISTAYKADLIVEDKIILELKSTEKESNLFTKQLLTYLKLKDKRLGLLINFNRSTLKEGLIRVVNGF